MKQNIKKNDCPFLSQLVNDYVDFFFFIFLPILHAESSFLTSHNTCTSARRVILPNLTQYMYL